MKKTSLLISGQASGCVETCCGTQWDKILKKSKICKQKIPLFWTFFDFLSQYPGFLKFEVFEHFLILSPLCGMDYPIQLGASSFNYFIWFLSTHRLLSIWKKDQWLYNLKKSVQWLHLSECLFWRKHISEKNTPIFKGQFDIFLTWKMILSC